MRLLVTAFLSIAGLCSTQAFAQGFSKEYTRCLNTAYGQTAVIGKCTETEYKAQEKRLKENYKTYLQYSGANQNNIQAQHKLWESRVQQQCYFKSSTEFAAVQRAKCVLVMTVNQADYYGSRFIAAK